MLRRKTLIIVVAIAILMIGLTTALASSGDGGKTLTEEQQWEDLYSKASQLVVAATHTRDAAKRQQLFREAAAFFEAALQISPDNVDTWNNLATTLYLIGESDKAFDLYTSLIQAHPEVSSAYMGRGHIYEERGEKVKARQDYVTYLKLIANRPGEVAEKQRLKYTKKIRELGDEMDDEQVQDPMNTDAQSSLEPREESISPEGF